MHHALEIDEVLLNIFAHCDPPRFKNYRHGRCSGAAADLVALARTCRTFKEPALEVLWSELPDLCPLAKCLPAVTYQLIPGFKWYSFKRPLKPAEWDILRSYTRRVRSVLDFGSAFHPDCVRTFLNPSAPEPLFPNLRYLRCVFANDVTPLLHQSFPSLINVDYSFAFEENVSLLQESLKSFPAVSPNMRKLSLRVHQPEAIFDKLFSDYVCRWSNPQSVFCPQIALDTKALMHLSRVPGLIELTFAASADTLIPSDTLLFPNLHRLKLFSETLCPVSKLLAHTRLPAVTEFTIDTTSYPSKQDLTSLMSALQPSGIGDAITRFKLTQIHHSLSIPRRDPLVLIANDLMPSVTLRNLRRLNVNLGWNVGLTDSGLLTLASAWPHLEHLLINEEWGWQTPGGITPDGLARLLETCRSLTRIALAIDTRGYTYVPAPRSPANLGPGPRADFPPLSINVVDSAIGATSVPAMAAFLAHVVPSARFSLTAWSSWAFTWRMNKKVYATRWNDVHAGAVEAIARHSSG